MALDTLPILNELELEQLHDGKMHKVAERAEIERKRDEDGERLCKLAYVIGKTKDGQVIFSTEGIKNGRKYFAGGMCTFDDGSEAGANIEIWDKDCIKSYKPLQYKK